MSSKTRDDRGQVVRCMQQLLEPSVSEIWVEWGRGSSWGVYKFRKMQNSCFVSQTLCVIIHKGKCLEGFIININKIHMLYMYIPLSLIYIYI